MVFCGELDVGLFFSRDEGIFDRFVVFFLRACPERLDLSSSTGLVEGLIADRQMPTDYWLLTTLIYPT